jgi:hypothetical protein
MPAAAVSRAQAAAGAAATVKMESGQRRVATIAEAPATPAAAAAPRRTGVWLGVGAVAVVVGVAGYFLVTRPVLVFQNRLLEPVRIMAGDRERVVEPSATLRVPLRRRMTLAAEWRMLRPMSPRGVAMGVELRGTIAVERPGGRVRQAAAARGPGGAYFAPLITNTTGIAITITVNAGLAAALSCNCDIPPGTTRARIGYYPLYVNSTVRAEDGKGHSAMFSDLGAQVDSTGVVSLRFGPGDLR